MKVKCINNNTMYGTLSVGKIYEVLYEGSVSYKISDDFGRDVYVAKSRFEIVEEDNNMEDMKNKFYNIDIFNWEDFKNGKIAVLCNTEELARDFLHKCDEQGIMWGTKKPSDNINAICLTGREFTTYTFHHSGYFGLTPYQWCQGNNIKVIQWEINNDQIEKTFQEVITTIKEREIWVCKKINRKIIKADDGIIEIRGLNDEIFDNVVALLFSDEKYKLQRKEYTFAEAFKAYEEGKEIESCEGDFYKYKRMNDSDYVFIKEHEHWLEFAEHEEVISFNEIRGKWYIND